MVVDGKNERGPEYESLFGFMGGGEDSLDSDKGKKSPPDDGGSHIMKRAIDKAVSMAQIHCLNVYDVEIEEDVNNYMLIKNSVCYDIIKETSFEQVEELMDEGMHTKTVHYKRIIDYAKIDADLLLEGILRDTKTTAIPELLGKQTLQQYFPNAKGEALVKEYKKEMIAYRKKNKKKPIDK